MKDIKVSLITTLYNESKNIRLILVAHNPYEDRKACEKIAYYLLRNLK